jgi:hypothetical protein
MRLIKPEKSLATPSHDLHPWVNDLLMAVFLEHHLHRFGIDGI